MRWRADTGVELTLTVQAVLDPVRTSAERQRGESFVATVVWVSEMGNEQIGRWSRCLDGRFPGRVMLRRRASLGSCCRQMDRHIRCLLNHGHLQRLELQFMI